MEREKNQFSGATWHYICAFIRSRVWCVHSTHTHIMCSLLSWHSFSNYFKYVTNCENSTKTGLQNIVSATDDTYNELMGPL